MVGSRGKYRERNKLSPKKEGRREGRGGRRMSTETVELYGVNTARLGAEFVPEPLAVPGRRGASQKMTATV